MVTHHSFPLCVEVRECERKLRERSCVCIPAVLRRNWNWSRETALLKSME